MSVGLFHPLDDAGGIGRVFEFNGNSTVDVELLDGLQIGGEFHDTSARRKVSVDLAIAVADVNVDGLAGEFGNFFGTIVGENEMGDVNIRPDARVIALTDKAGHFIDAVEDAEAEGLQFQGDVDPLAVSVVAKNATGFDAPSPLFFGRDDFALPEVFSKDEEDIAGAPSLGKIDELFAPGDVVVTNGIVKIDEADSHDREGEDREVLCFADLFDLGDFLRRNHGRFGKDID